MSAPYPWQARAWSVLCSARRGARPGHAWLLTGRPGIGKHDFALRFARFVLCEAPAPDDSPCGECRSCLLFDAGNHPDLRQVGLLEDASSIAIDQIRELADFFALTAHYGRAKVVLLAPADRMTRGAANALLKMLEEPPAMGLFILVADQLEQLPATIRSRCQRLSLDSIDPMLARDWLAANVPEATAAECTAALALARHAPLAARTALNEGDLALANRLEAQLVAVASGRVHAVQAAESCADIAPAKLADLLLALVHRAALAAVGAAGEGVADAAGGLNRLPNPIHSRQLCEFAVSALDIKRQAVPTANFRQGDLVDLLWQAWMKATRSRPPRTPSA